MKFGRKIAILSAIMGLALSATVCGGRELGNNATESGITGSGNVATAPTVTSTTPANDATTVNRDSTILINFSVSVNAATVTMTSNATCTGSVQVSVDNFANCLPMNQTITQSGTQVTVRTASLMAATTPHRVRITTAVAGVTGLTMTTQYETTFTTGTSITPLTNEFGTDCSAGAGTISAFKTAATGTEGAVGPIVINGLVVTGIDRFGSFYLQKGTEGIYVDVNTNAGACGGSNCQGNKASHYGMQVGDEICLSITRAVESNNVDTVKDYDAIKKTGIGSVTPAVLTDVFAVADISEWVRISGFLTTKTSGGNVNHTLTFADGKTITLRDNTSNKFTSVNQNDFIEVTSVSSWFSGAPQIMIDTGVGTVSTGVTAPSYAVTGTVNGWRSGENFTLTLNGSNATVISANGAFSFTGSPTVSGQYTVAISINPPNDQCVIGNATGFATSNISSVTVTCTPKPMYQFTEWASSESANSYPLAMQVFTHGSLPETFTTGNYPDATFATSLYTSAYNLTSGISRAFGEGSNGLSFINIGTGPFLGAVVLTLDTTGKTNMRLNWTARTITTQPRPYGILVQTRPNTGAAWTSIPSNLYTVNGTSGHSQNFTATDISALDNQLQGQVRFVYFQTNTGTSGSRPTLAVDDVVVYSASNAKPWLTAFSPAVSATGISVTPTISVTFNKSMNTGTVTTGNLYIVAGTNCSNTAITATISTSNSDRTFTFSPTGLTGSTQYSTCVKAAIADTTGDTIGTDRMISWTTTAVDVTPPTISSTTPANGATGVATSSTVAVTFSEAMNTGTVTAQTSAGACSGSVQVSTQASNFAACIAMTAAAPTFSGGNTVATFTPASTLTASTTYLIRVTTAVQDASNNALAAQFTTATGFTTAAADVTPPTISSTTPANAATGVSTSSTIAVTFSEAMSTGTVTAQTSAGACSGSVQVSLDNFTNCIAMGAAAPTFTVGNTVATWTPASALTATTTYKIRVTTAVQDASNNALASQFETATGFTTGAGATGGSIVISQVYGGGGNAGALWKQDFVELFNRTNAAVSINGWSLQYQAAGTTGTYGSVFNLPNVTIPAYSYYLIRCAAGAGGTDILVADNTTCGINLSGTAGKIAVVKNTTAIAHNTALPNVNISDLIGFGGTANQFEGATAPAPSNTTSLRRGSAGCTDADANNTDLTAFTLTGTAGTDFRNSGTATNTCP